MLFISGNALITNGTATVTVNGLECGVTYTITAGGVLNNGSQVGPTSPYGIVTTGPCPISTTGSFCILCLHMYYMCIAPNNYICLLT